MRPRPLPERILAIDVGAGTQDILLYERGKPMEASIKLVLPSQTEIVARRIRRATRAGRDIFLVGNLMGGGPNVSVIKRHLRAGHRVYATPRAAKTVRDNLRQVEEMGVQIVKERPPGALSIETRDVDLKALAASYDLPLVYDLGSGDGRIVLTTARRFGARAVGIEVDPFRFILCIKIRCNTNFPIWTFHLSCLALYTSTHC